MACPLRLAALAPNPPPTIAMPQTTLESASHATYLRIFDSAKIAYEKKTGKCLRFTSLFYRLNSCYSPDNIIIILRRQIPPSYLYRCRDDRVTRWLNPTVNVIIAFSANIRKAIREVSLTDYEMTPSESAH